jgi:D-serine deaminase-like pyridoxal phosphate-dependent protein
MQLRGDLRRPVTCATAYEAAILATCGFQDILVANEVVGAAALAALARAAQKCSVTVAADSEAHIVAYRRLAEMHAIQLGVLIEVDVGMGRCGLAPGDPRLVTLAEIIAGAPRLCLKGLQGYEGHAVLLPTRSARRAKVNKAADILRREQARLREAGFGCDVVSGGGTGTFDIAAESGAWTEIQAGSYVLLDDQYSQIDLPFEAALYCCAHVVSRPGEQLLILNCGLKALSAEFGMPRCLLPQAEVIGLGDEHARVVVPPACQAEVGDTVFVIPRHLDPTVNLHDSMYVWSKDGGLAQWRIDGHRTGSLEKSD